VVWMYGRNTAEYEVIETEAESRPEPTEH
jgi:hypothetical protein